MAAFDSDAFDTEAFSVDAFDFEVLAGIIAANISQGQTIGDVSLTQHNALSVNPLAQSQTLSNIILAIAGVLQVLGLSQSQSIGIASLVQHNSITVDPVTQSQAIDNIELVDNALILDVDAINQVQSIGETVLTQQHILAVDSITQSQLITSIFFGGVVIGYLKGELSVFSAYNGEIQIVNTLKLQ